MFSHYLRIILVIWKYTGVFQGGFFSGRGEVVTWEDPSMEEFLWGRESSMEKGPDFPALLRKRSEIKYKIAVFFQVKVRSDIKT